MNELALFAGAGGGILGGKLLGWRTVCAVERDAYAAQVLAQRQNDGVLEAFPIWSDVTTFDGKRWRGFVDVISGGFPCQDISAAGKGAGITGERSGLWCEMARIIGDVRPRYVFVENSPMLTTRGLGIVLRDLAQMGYDAEWGCLSAAEVGANHKRERIWILASDSRNAERQLADTDLLRGDDGQTEIDTAKAELNAQRDVTASSENVSNTSCQRWATRRSDDGQHDWAEFNAGDQQRKNVADANQKKPKGLCVGEKTPYSGIGICSNDALPNTACQDAQRMCGASRISAERTDIGDACWWHVEPNVGRVANGVAFRVDRLKGIGNGQVPLCAATAFQLLRGRLDATR